MSCRACWPTIPRPRPRSIGCRRLASRCSGRVLEVLSCGVPQAAWQIVRAQLRRDPQPPSIETSRAMRFGQPNRPGLRTCRETTQDFSARGDKSCRSHSRQPKAPDRAWALAQAPQSREGGIEIRSGGASSISERLAIPAPELPQQSLFDSYDPILGACCAAWDAPMAIPDRITSNRYQRMGNGQSIKPLV